MRTMQEVFDIAVAGILKQGGPSVDGEGKCLYRKDGTAECPVRCAIGHVLPDAAYLPKAENWSPRMLRDSVGVGVGVGVGVDTYLALGMEDTDDNCQFLEELQDCHDQCVTFLNFIKEFTTSVKKLAKKYHLSVKILKQKAS